MLPARDDPLQLHFELKRRGSGFSDIARRTTKGARHVTPQNVRGVVYGFMSKNDTAIWAEIETVLADPIEHGKTRLAA